jgi:hypothetical protein
MIITKSNAISTLGNWEYSIWNNDLDTLKFYQVGVEINKPNNFPTNQEIENRRLDMQNKFDSGLYNSLEELYSSYNS